MAPKIQTSNQKICATRKRQKTHAIALSQVSVDGFESAWQMFVQDFHEIEFSTDFDIFVSQKNQHFKKEMTNSEPDGEETHKKNRFKNHQTMMNLVQQ